MAEAGIVLAAQAILAVVVAAQVVAEAVEVFKNGNKILDNFGKTYV